MGVFCEKCVVLFLLSVVMSKSDHGPYLWRFASRTISQKPKWRRTSARPQLGPLPGTSMATTHFWLKLKGHRHEIQWICTERLPNRWLQRVRMGQVHGSKKLLLEISFAVQSTEQKQAVGA